MSETVFTKVDYSLKALIDKISLGEIGLPDIQRPFVWPNIKVRDLFDSMYKGYPVGYFLFWQNESSRRERTIGVELKQKAANLVIVDGQQRLTSLYAVVKGIPVVKKNYDKEKIYIAFNPIEEKFQVTDAAIRRNKSYIQDISSLWSEGSNLFKVVGEYLSGLRESRDISDTEEDKIQTSISKLYGLLGYPFTALELISEVDEEAVSDVFVRINSKGTKLNEADFILTLMSVFWDEGRKELELFYRGSRKPSSTGPSSYNHFIEPTPDQLLRVDVGVAFKRARLKYVYSILRGKDLETEKYSDERRDQQFEVLKDAQLKVLNLGNWHEFLNCIRQAGFRSKKMISSDNNLLFAYILYLIGKKDYRIPEFELRKVIAKWFFMSAVTRRFTDSPESRMESDLARFRGITEPQKFLEILNHVCDITLTSDFWSVTLPNNLATSSASSPSLYAYHAALVLLDAKALFSKVKISDLLDPTIQSVRAGVERHHLFPKGYLKSLNITEVKDTNQIANYAFVEWRDNSDISDKSPAEYVPEFKARFAETELEQMYDVHAMPINWENMEYGSFLQKRRELIAEVIKKGYESLCDDTFEVSNLDATDFEHLILEGESDGVEFKSTLRINLHTNNPDPKIELSSLKTIAGFLNSRGGTLVIGVADDGSPVGIETDGFPNEDKFSLHLVNLVKNRISPMAFSHINLHFEDLNGSRILFVKCNQSHSPVFVKDGNIERFYIRTGPATSELSASQIQEYISQRFQ